MQHNDLWAPWRIRYLRDLEDSEQEAGQERPECFLCAYREDEQSADRDNLLLWRCRHHIIVMNRYPYTAGHLLIAPREHIDSLEAMSETMMSEMMRLCRDSQVVLREVLRPHGFNVGINFGRCSGAGLPGHLHMHVVPRWNGDTNFMSVAGNARVISQSLHELFDELRAAADKLGMVSLIGEK